MKNIKKLIEYPKTGIISKVIDKNGNMETTLFCMAKKTGMDEHTSTKRGIIYVVEGEGIFNLEGKDIKMLPGVFISMEKNAVHSLKAIKNTSFLLVLTS
jgi:nitric oxide dioxygenase